MKAVSIALSMFIFVLFTITLVACDNATSGTDHGSGDISNSCNNGNCSDAQIQQNEDGQISNDESGQTSHCGDGVCNIFEGDTPENCLNCADDCPCSNGLVCNDVGTCGEDPLIDYYWLEGQWQCESVNGHSCGEIVNVTVEAWNNELGAEVHGFDPWNVAYIKKNPKNEQFELSIIDENDWAKGTANPSTLIVEFTTVINEEQLNVKYIKL